MKRSLEEALVFTVLCIGLTIFVTNRAIAHWRDE